MLIPRIIPCLDCRDGRVVKGVRFQGLRDAGSPEELAGAYEAQGADELVLLDVSATPEGRGHQLETVRRVRAQLAIPMTVGGGVRTADDVGRLLEAGADKVSVNTAAVQTPQIISDIATRFGSQCAILALDAARRQSGGSGSGAAGNGSGPDGSGAGGTRGAVSVGGGGAACGGGSVGAAAGWEVVVRSGRERTGIDAVAWAREAVARGAGEILLTSWDRDGTRAGYDLELLGAICEAVQVPVIASGGAATPEHLVAALRAGADAVLAASIFHFGEYTVQSLKVALHAAGMRVRLSCAS